MNKDKKKFLKAAIQKQHITQREYQFKCQQISHLKPRRTGGSDTTFQVLKENYFLRERPCEENENTSHSLGKSYLQTTYLIESI